MKVVFLRSHLFLSCVEIYYGRAEIYLLSNHRFASISSCVVNVTVHILANVLHVLLEDSTRGYTRELGR